MLRGNPVASPPEEPVLEGGVVEQGPGHILRLQLTLLSVRGAHAPVLQGPQEKPGAVAVVVRRKQPVVRRVIRHTLPEEIPDLLVGPPLDGRPVADADDLGQPACIYSFYI